MRLVIAYVPNKLRPEVRALGESVGAEFADVSASDTAYGELISGLFSAGLSFALQEHDILPTREVLEEMWACPEPWCHAFAWRYISPVAEGETKPRRPIREKEFGLFLNKFDESLLAQTAHVIGGFKVRWQSVDLVLLGVLAQHAPCQHGPVIHLHQQHPPWAAAMTADDWSRVDA